MLQPLRARCIASCMLAPTNSVLQDGTACLHPVQYALLVACRLPPLQSEPAVWCQATCVTAALSCLSHFARNHCTAGAVPSCCLIVDKLRRLVASSCTMRRGAARAHTISETAR